MFDQPEAFESDLEWLLRSSQATPEMIVDHLIKDQYPAILRHCRALVGDPGLAALAALDSVLLAVEKRHEYREKTSTRAWLAALTLQSCRQQLRRAQGWPVSRSEADLAASRSLPAMQGLNPAQLRLRRALNALRAADLELLLLSDLFDLPDEDLADLTHHELEETRRRLEEIRRKIHGVLPAGVSAGAEKSASLAELWPEISLDPDVQEHLVGHVLLRLEQRQHRRVMARFVQQFAAALGILALAAGIIWISNRFSERQTPNPFVAQTVIVTRLVYITPAPTPTTVPPALTLDAPEDQVRDRLMHSRDTWQNLWAEALIYDYGPVGYVGPPEIQREQIWFNQPDHIVILSGPAGKRSTRLFYQEGGVRYVRDFGEGTFRQLGQQPLSDFSMLARLLQPKTWIDGSVEISVEKISFIAGRLVVWVSIIDDDHAYRIALDRFKGVIMGMQQYDPETGLVFREVVFTQIAYEPKPVLSVFESGMLPTNFVRDYSGLPLLPDEVELLPAVELAPPRQALERISTQEEVDFSKSELAFQWRSQGEMISEGVSFNDVKFVPVEIFAGENFLGEIILANPWGLLCRRSPDGSKLAFLEQPAAAPFPSGRLRWLDLTQSVDQTYHTQALLPEHREVGGDFAFSPDGNNLAFWGCWAEKEQCGIYIADLVTGGAPVVWVMDYATSFRWSPDGQALGFIRWFYNELVVLDLNGYVVRHRENLRQEDREALRPEEFAWLSEPVVEAAGLESCGLPPNLP